MTRAVRIWLICAGLALLGLAQVSVNGPVYAQTVELPDEAEWIEVVDRVEITLDSDRASDDALNALRTELADWRNRFEEAQTINATSIRTVMAQIDALGPEPAEGDTEPASVAELRTLLTERLDVLRVPQRRAEVAFNRADALIAEIDQTLWSRQTARLTERVPSPLLPAVWSRSIRDIQAADFRLQNEIRRIWSSPASAAQIRERVPLSIALFLIGSVLLIAGRRVTERTTLRFQAREAAGSQVIAFLVSLLQLIVPFIGLGLMYFALTLVFDGGSLSEAMLAALLNASLVLVTVRWLATSVFPKPEAANEAVWLSDDDRKRGRQLVTSVGFLLGLHIVMEGTAEAGGFESETFSFLNYPLILIGAFLFWRLSILLKGAGPEENVSEGEDGQTEKSFLSRVLWFLGQAVLLLAMLAVIAGTVGYWSIASYLIFPAIRTLGVFAAITVLHGFFRNLYALLMGLEPEASRQALFPVLVTFVTTIAAVPLLAVIWGARWTDVANVLELLGQGVTIGDANIGLNAFLTIAIVFFVGFSLTRLLQASLRTVVLPRTKMDIGARNAVISGVGYIGITLAAIVAITVAGVDLTGVALIASALSVGIGFGLQTIVSNFISGLILLAERPISEGDWIEVGGQMGIVKDISVRSTRIQTFDRTDVIVPNSDLIAGTVTNWTRGNTIGRVIVAVGVAYTSDSKKVEAILQEIAEAHPMVSLNPPPSVFFRRFGADALEFDVRCILRDVNFLLRVHSDLNHSIHQRFREEGIEIPFAQRDVWLRNPEVLPGGSASQAAEDLDEPATLAPNPDPDIDTDGEKT